MVQNLEFNQEEYISIYKLAEIIGRNVESLKNPNSRRRFSRYIDKLPEGMIRKVKLNKRIVSDSDYPSVKVLYSIESVEKFMKENIRKSEVLKLLKGIYGRLQRLEKEENIPIYELGNVHELKFYPRKNIEKIFSPFNKEKYMTIYELAQTKFGKESNNDKFIRNLRAKIDELPNGMILKKKLDRHYYDIETSREIKEIYSRSHIEKFFSNYISKDKTFKEIEAYTNIGTIRKYYKKLKIKGIVLGGNSDVFILKSDYEKIKLICIKVANRVDYESTKVYADILGYLTFKDVQGILKLTEPSAKKLIKSNIIKVKDVFNGTKLFEKGHINKLLKEQKNLLAKYKRDYYTISEIREQYGIAFANYIRGSQDKIRRPIEKEEVPIILVGNINYRNRMFYNKFQVDSVWNDYKLYNKMNSLSIENPFDDFVYKVEQVLKVTFKESQRNTKSLWYQYVKKFLYETKLGDKSRIIFRVHQFARNTEMIFNIFKREIYSYSASEINKLYLNGSNDINRSYQRDFYNFLKQMIDLFIVNGLPLPFNGYDLTNPKTYQNIKEIDTSSYSLEEYHALYEYTNRVVYHKEKAIKDVKRLLKTMDITKYKRYDSCWLYILIQLTKNWRHSTVITQIPRIDLSYV